MFFLCVVVYLISGVMKLQLVKYLCGSCKFEFSSPQLKVGSYAEFLLRSKSRDDIVYLNAIEDKTYDEVDVLIKSNPKLKGKSGNIYASILRKSYGAIACDPSKQGGGYQIGALPVCPSCCSQSMDYWEFIEPPEFVDRFVSHVTHSGWEGLNMSEKIKKVDMVLSEFGY